eukprot:scaffold10321_cov122-Isochrysis_galbana.AAC.5
MVPTLVIICRSPRRVTRHVEREQNWARPASSEHAHPLRPGPVCMMLFLVLTATTCVTSSTEVTSHRQLSSGASAGCASSTLSEMPAASRRNRAAFAFCSSSSTLNNAWVVRGGRGGIALLGVR